MTKEVAALNSRFGDLQIENRANMDILLSLPNIKSCFDICLLRKMLDTIETAFRNLRPYDTNYYSPILISVAMKKLPEEFRLKLSR